MSKEESIIPMLCLEPYPKVYQPKMTQKKQSK